ncbi:hypothetical protein N657DRAFT_636570 [Parathielavia appendiculata]|uniref:Uncharacterized protein n=1 Tax=Parathielavia appendiculata TaxID=2587402 RepID=A0AAN6TTD8_9PEZI|nr:hypothetical protein N657DRAFT_636570 [Parathielavia appendiculata]
MAVNSMLRNPMDYDLKLLPSIRHLAQYAAFANEPGDAGGAYFRRRTPDLPRPSKLDAMAPSSITQTPQIHLGIRDKTTLVVVFVATIRHGSTRISFYALGTAPGSEDAWVHERFLDIFDNLRGSLDAHIRRTLVNQPEPSETMRKLIVPDKVEIRLPSPLRTKSYWTSFEIFCMVWGIVIGSAIHALKVLLDYQGVFLLLLQVQAHDPKRDMTGFQGVMEGLIPQGVEEVQWKEQKE